MTLIKLSQQCVISKQGKYGWEDEYVFEPLYINPAFIESMSWAGLTYITMQSGDKFKVSETPEDVDAMVRGAENGN